MESPPSTFWLLMKALPILEASTQRCAEVGSSYLIRAQRSAQLRLGSLIKVRLHITGKQKSGVQSLLQHCQGLRYSPW
ncbi:hypothetical protein BKA82DRAFT_992512 [Pisolithus tinctorius]|uniref:Uncharacterized protein n=1 Tax=Pisolithus tinctorius Marx 270 TaxID=870435 RepID=A0A0C3PXP3_PISTI|nr:hypothetical protein BKA82DRAFT_992512 [Pisolithus tinctorius]KIO14246.1 hypothetical protein M404DRAFT_992512 [Pisolithus tinctorius Marx 270]